MILNENETEMKQESNETKEVKSSEFYKDVKKALRYIAYGIVIFFTLMLFYAMFGIYVYISVIIMSVWFFILYKFIIKVKGRKFLTIDIPNGEVRQIFIPAELFKEYKNNAKHKHFNNLEIVKMIDHDKKIITGYWFSDFSDVDFLVEHKAFDEVCTFLMKYIDRNAVFLQKYDVMAMLKAIEYLRDWNKMLIDMPEEIELKSEVNKNVKR